MYICIYVVVTAYKKQIRTSAFVLCNNSDMKNLCIYINMSNICEVMCY